MFNSNHTLTIPRMLVACFCLMLGVSTSVATEPSKVVTVNITDIARAESDRMIRANIKTYGGRFNTFNHRRNPTTAENQPVIRMNQDTLYSGTAIDLSKPITITLPEVGERYMSLQVISQDHYTIVKSEPGSYELTEAMVGSRFAMLAIRTFYNAGDPKDLAKAHAAQDKVTISGGGNGPFEAPNWDSENLALAIKALNDLAVLGFDTRHAFGRKEEVRPIDHLIGATAGWGGMPPTAAIYILDSVKENNGKTPYSLTVKDVPVDAFWSITVYNENGYLAPNDLGINSFNNISAKPNKDGSYTIRFGGNPKKDNYLPITKGWNYVVRLYQPRQEILDGTWTFPTLKLIKK